VQHDGGECEIKKRRSVCLKKGLWGLRQKKKKKKKRAGRGRKKRKKRRKGRAYVFFVAL
jgi:hypothetical protein